MLSTMLVARRCQPQLPSASTPRALRPQESSCSCSTISKRTRYVVQAGKWYSCNTVKLIVDVFAACKSYWKSPAISRFCLQARGEGSAHASTYLPW